MNPGEGLNISQGGVWRISAEAQFVTNEKCLPGDVSQQPALNDNLMERILSPENLHAAWKQVKGNKGAPGVDRVSIEEYPQWAKRHWTAIRRVLEGGYLYPAAGEAR